MGPNHHRTAALGLADANVLGHSSVNQTSPAYSFCTRICRKTSEILKAATIRPFSSRKASRRGEAQTVGR